MAAGKSFGVDRRLGNREHKLCKLAKVHAQLLCVDLVAVEGKPIPTELRGDAVELRKAMKYDDEERAGKVTMATLSWEAGS